MAGTGHDRGRRSGRAGVPRRPDLHPVLPGGDGAAVPGRGRGARAAPQAGLHLGPGRIGRLLAHRSLWGRRPRPSGEHLRPRTARPDGPRRRRSPPAPAVRPAPLAPLAAPVRPGRRRRNRPGCGPGAAVGPRSRTCGGPGVPVPPTGLGRRCALRAVRRGLRGDGWRPPGRVRRAHRGGGAVVDRRPEPPDVTGRGAAVPLVDLGTAGRAALLARWGAPGGHAARRRGRGRAGRRPRAAR